MQSITLGTESGISLQDLPRKFKPGDISSLTQEDKPPFKTKSTFRVQETSKDHSSFPFVPGASELRSTPGRGTGWYCRACLAFVEPIFIGQDDAIFPACYECFYNDLPLSEGIGEVEESCVEIIETPIGVASADPKPAV